MGHLHSHGADLNAADGEGTAPVHVAAVCGRYLPDHCLDALRFLHERGADMRATGWLGENLAAHLQLRDAKRTPLEWARAVDRLGNGIPEIVRYLESVAPALKRERSLNVPRLLA